MSARVSKKAPKDVNAPKKPLSSYFMFTRDRRSALKASQPDAKITELTKIIAVEWKALDAATKEKYAAEAAQAKAQYAVKWSEYQKTAEFGKYTLQLAAWKAQRGEADAKTSAKGGVSNFKPTKKPKDAKAPKRPQTGFFLFAAAERAAVKAAQPELKVTQISKELGRRWQALSAEEKAPFEAQAAAAKEAYAVQLREYKQSADFAAHEAAVAAWKRSEKAAKAAAQGKDAGPQLKVSLPRKPKDSKCPKRPQSGYFLFTATRRAELSAAHADKKMTDIAKLMGAEWKALSEEEKAPFQAQAAKEKEAYAAKMEAYKGSEEQQAYEAQVREWEAECARRRQKAMDKMDKKMAHLELSKQKAAQAQAKVLKKKKKKFVEYSSDEEDSESSRSYSSASTSGSESSSESDSYSD